MQLVVLYNKVTDWLACLGVIFKNRYEKAFNEQNSRFLAYEHIFYISISFQQLICIYITVPSFWDDHVEKPKCWQMKSEFTQNLKKKLEYFHFWAFQFNSFFKYVWIFPVLKNDPVYIITTVKIWYRYEDIIFHLCTHLPLAYLYTLYLLSKKTRKKSGLSLPSYQLFKALWVDLGIFSFFIFMEVFK